MESITKSVLLKTDPLLQNRPYQIDALLSIFKHQKCLVKMFCGTGKSRIITNVIIHNKKDLSVIVFPSHVYHQVTPVTKGTRYSLVGWNLGYPFR